MGLGHGSFGQELWLGFFPVVGSLELHQASVRFITLCLSTITHIILMSVPCQHEFDRSRGEERWWEDFLVGIPVRPRLSPFPDTGLRSEKLTRSKSCTTDLGATA